MQIARIYQAIPLDIDIEFQLNEKASHYVARVLRAKCGDTLTLFNGMGGEYQAVIRHIDKQRVTVAVLLFVPRDVESPLHIHLAQGIARGEKMDFIVQKATELGVATITPLMTKHSQVRWDDQHATKRLGHWQSVAISACEQSTRNCPPIIMPPLLLNQWLETVRADLCLVLSLHAEKNSLSSSLPSNANIVLLIGPEGGLSEDEVHAACKMGFLPLRLGPRVLRTETATIVAMSLLQFYYGDMRVKPI